MPVKWSLCVRAFAANDVVAFNHSGHADSFLQIFRVLIDANYTAVSANEDFRAASNLGGKRQREIDLGAGRKIILQSEVNSARGDIAGLATLRAGFPVDRHADVDGKRQIVATRHAAFSHGCGSITTGLDFTVFPPETKSAIGFPKHPLQVQLMRPTLRTAALPSPLAWLEERG